jgi:heme a synthase
MGDQFYPAPMTSDYIIPLAVRCWLWIVAALIFAMVIVGGATRLTDSGLSITEWQPLLGAIPPLNESDWLLAFEKYKQIPEFKLQNRWMELSDFKFIYWWEWAHRFLGRIIGLVFLLPMLAFMALGMLPKSTWLRLGGLFVLGGLQGALGWYMVSSGLSERTDVSQYRLAAHLTLAFLLFAAVVWTALEYSAPRGPSATRGTKRTLLLLVLILMQVAIGGFVAGLDAGHASYTWPKMDGAWFPANLLNMQPAWRNFFENVTTVQFTHRLMAYAVLIFAVVLWIGLWNHRMSLVLAAICGQALLGIATVMLEVPLSVALLHQGGALVVVALTLWHLHGLRTGPVPDRR